MTSEQFVQQYREADVRTLALRASKQEGINLTWCLQQIEGWQMARHKLPAISAIDGWHYPHKLSMEQCSSERTALYKVAVLKRYLEHHFETTAYTLTDLTGGLGIDCFYLSTEATVAHYVEMQAELCEIARHNFALTSRSISVHHTTAEDYLSNIRPVTNSDSRLIEKSTHREINSSNSPSSIARCFFIDPARRSASGGKVVRIEDCTPDLTTLYTILLSVSDLLMVKLSPMLDITAALRALPHTAEVHVIAVQGEVKEVLLLIDPHTASAPEKATIIATNLLKQSSEQSDNKHGQRFCFSQAEEATYPTNAFLSAEAPKASQYLYEPNAAILKAGAYLSIADAYGLSRIAQNTHLYLSHQLVENFPGRVFHIIEAVGKRAVGEQTGSTYRQANVLTRNYPLTPEQLRKKLHINDGGNTYLIGCTTAAKPMIYACERVQ